MRLARVILFDADGVVIDPPHRFASYMRKVLGINTELSRPFFDGPFQRCLLGQADLKEEIAPYLSRWGFTGGVDAFLRHWFEVENTVNETLMTFIQQLRQKGYRCGIATNQEKHRLHYMAQSMSFVELFDDLFGSSHVGAVKPMRDFYERVTKRLAVSPADIIFVDDTLVNVEAAVDFGWRAKQYTSFQDMKSWLFSELRYWDR